MDATALSFRDDLEAKLASIEGVLRSTHAEQGRRDGAVRKLAHLLAASGHAHGLREVSEAADLVLRSDAAGLGQAAEKLIVILRRVVNDPSLRRPVVLLVGPDGDRRRDLRTLLDGPDREVVTAGPAEVEPTLRSRDVAVLLVDADPSGPWADLLRLVHRLRARPRTALLPVLALCEPHDQTLCFTCGVDACVAAPQSPEAIAAAVDASLRRAEALARTCRKDPLTGLPNRAALAELFQHQTAAAARAGQPVAIAVIELDGLPALEETHGPQVADELVRHLAQVLASVLRRDDVIAAWEDERLVALFTGQVRGAARALTKGLRALRARPYELAAAAASIELSFTAGVAPVAASTALDEAVAEADRRLWRARAADVQGIHTGEVEAGGPRTRVLVALHDQARAAEVGHRLRTEGFDVLSAGDGEAALRAARAADGAPALCILGARLPIRDGFNVLERLRRGPVAARVPVIVITSGREADAKQAFDLGADDHLPQLFSTTELVARVRRLLRRRALSLSGEGVALDGGSPSAIVGKFEGDQLIEFMQMLGVTGKTGVLRISCDTFSASIYIEQGRIVSASTSIGSRPLEAAFEAVLTPHGRFTFVPSLPFGLQRELSLPIEGFLLEVLRRRDELGRRAN